MLVLEKEAQTAYELLRASSFFLGNAPETEESVRLNLQLRRREKETRDERIRGEGLTQPRSPAEQEKTTWSTLEEQKEEVDVDVSTKNETYTGFIESSDTCFYKMIKRSSSALI